MLIKYKDSLGWSYSLVLMLHRHTLEKYVLCDATMHFDQCQYLSRDLSLNKTESQVIGVTTTLHFNNWTEYGFSPVVKM